MLFGAIGNGLAEIDHASRLIIELNFLIPLELPAQTQVPFPD